MQDIAKYEQLKAIGKSPREVYLSAKADSVGELDAFIMLRTVFGLSMADAKQAMLEHDPFRSPQKVEVGRTVFWEGADTIDGLWIMEATVKKVDHEFAYLEHHRKYLIRPEGLVAAPASGALMRIPLKYFEKPLAERLQESTDFWGQLASLTTAGN